MQETDTHSLGPRAGVNIWASMSIKYDMLKLEVHPSFPSPLAQYLSSHLTSLPDLDAVDSERSLLLVRRPVVPPPILCSPEIGHCRSGVVDPWFTTFTIWEPTVGSSNSKVQDQVECWKISFCPGTPERKGDIR